jgi:hypothetical protein
MNNDKENKEQDENKLILEQNNIKYQAIINKRRINYEKNKEKKIEMAKEWNKKNSELIKVYKKTFYQKHKGELLEKNILCPVCNKNISKLSQYMHNKSKKHIKKQNENNIII